MLGTCMRRRLLPRARLWRRVLSQRVGPRRMRPTAAIGGGPMNGTTAAGTAAESGTGTASAVVTVTAIGSARGTAFGIGIALGDRSSGMTAGTMAETDRGTTSGIGGAIGMTGPGTADVKAEAGTTDDAAVWSHASACGSRYRLQVWCYEPSPEERERRRNDLPCMNDWHDGRIPRECTSACLPR